MSAALEAAELEQVNRQRQLDDRTLALRMAEQAYLLSDSDKDLDKVQRERLKAERARTVYAAAVKAVEAERAAVRHKEVEEARATHAEDLLSLPHHGDYLAALTDRLIDIDRTLDDLLLAFAKTCADGAKEWDAAQTRAQLVGSSLGSIKRPALADAIHAARVRATEVRTTENREDASELVSTIDLNWKVANLTANERAALSEGARQ